MIDLIKFELKKIFSKTLVKVTLLIALIFNILLYISSSAPSFTVLPNENSEYLHGREAVLEDKNITQKYQGILTDERVKEMLKDFKPSDRFLKKIKGVKVSSVPMNSMQLAVQSKFAKADGRWNGLKVKDIYGQNQIEVGYNTGWLSTAWYMIKVIAAIGLVLIVMISPIFSNEYSGMDTILFTSKYGKTKSIHAKVIAAFIATFSITAMFIIINLIAALISFGTEGLNSSILFSSLDYFKYIPFNISCKTMLGYEIILAFTSAFSVTGLTLIISALCKTKFVALIFSYIIYVLPIILPISKQNPLYKFIILSPIYQTQFISIMSFDKISFLGNEKIFAILAVPAAVIICAIGWILSRKIYSKHQVA